MVFSEGTDFGSTMVKQAIAKARHDSRVAAANQGAAEQFNWEGINSAIPGSKDY